MGDGIANGKENAMVRGHIGSAFATTLALVVLPVITGAQDVAQKNLEVMTADVSVLCPLTVGGSFEAKTKALSGALTVAPDNPQAIDAALLVDLGTLETGIRLRDNHLKNKYLEVEKGPEFSHARLSDVRLDRLHGRTTFQGVLTLHGQTRPVSGTADIRPEGDGYRLTASFPVRVSEFGIPEPSYLGVGVKDEIVVRVRMHAAPTSEVASLRQRGGAPAAVGTSGKASK
jgi:polyisoprenoid-binding protein YceI